ncbi:MAG: hypothetical protein Kow00121_13400 [Elainellaceae cyanobacterium]
MSFSVSFLIDELKQNGIAANAPQLIQHPAILAELSYALSPTLHEGKLQPYGFIVVEKSHLSAVQSSCGKSFINLSQARRVADGCHSFSLFKDGQFQGIFLPQYAAYTELQLVQLQQELNAVICITDASGITKLFCDAGIFIHQYRSWQSKPSVDSALRSIHRCTPQADPETLKNMLEFCFHDLSPRKIGATLVWCLSEPTAQEFENMKPNFVLQQIDTRVGSDRSVAVLRHLLTYNDGAAILDPEARAIGVGAQLKYSDRSKRLIEARSGTRHTSAQRFSYDFAKGIVFTISSDGPVTVFSDGMSITDLKVHFTNQPVTEPSEDPPMPEDVLFSCTNELNCTGCGKRLKIQEMDGIEAYRVEKSLYCPVCGEFIYSAQCNNLDVYVLKEW